MDHLLRCGPSPPTTRPEQPQPVDGDFPLGLTMFGTSGAEEPGAWTVEQLSKHEVVGLQFLYRALRLERLVTRRFDLIEFADETTLRRTSRFDLWITPIDVPPEVSVVDEVDAPSDRDAGSGLDEFLTAAMPPADMVAVPLTSVPRTAKTTFEARDNDSSLLPLLTKPAERDLLFVGLTAMLRQRVPGIRESTLDRIRELVVDTTPTADQVVQAIRQVDRRDRERLETPRIASAIMRCATRYYVTVLLPAEITRRVVSLTWMSSVRAPFAKDGEEHAPRRKKKTRSPMGTHSIGIDAGAAGYCAPVTTHR